MKVFSIAVLLVLLTCTGCKAVDDSQSVVSRQSSVVAAESVVVPESSAAPVSVAAVVSQNGSVLIDSFEGDISGGPQGTVDYGSGNGSSVVVSAATDIKQDGLQSLKVEYDAIQDGYMWMARGFGLDAVNAAWIVMNTDIDWTVYANLSFSLYGNAGKEVIAVDVKDAGGEMWRYKITDDTAGWKTVVCPLNQFEARSDWQPDSADKNGMMDFPLKSYQFEVLAPAKGVVYFDKVELTK